MRGQIILQLIDFKYMLKKTTFVPSNIRCSNRLVTVYIETLETDIYENKCEDNSITAKTLFWKAKQIVLHADY